jgi:hypothetical protein
MIHLNASDERGIDIIRNQINQFVNSKTLFNKGMKFVILDEVDYMTKNAQQALRYLLQNYSSSVRFCLICNYISKIDEGLQAIKQERRPGILLLTNPRDEFDQRVELILALPAFKNAISNMVMIRVDIDNNPHAMMHYGFYKTPSFVLFDSEGNIRRKIQSVTDLESLLQELQNLK